MKRTKTQLLGILLFGSIAALSMSGVRGQILSTPVYMQDTPSDTGVEPNPDTGPMWVSQDIWVRNSPDPNYQPEPFPEASPPWTLPASQDAVYRDPLKSTPNYVYVEVRNHSTVASTGQEVLKVYWAKGSTGLSWPAQWVDYEPGGPLTPLFGAEITKPRKNAATASPGEISAYVNAILAIAGLTFPVGGDYWHIQQTEHDLMGMNSNIHDTLAFLPWHREFVNRYELLLQQHDPTVKLLYWDWTTDPTSLDTATFMGNAAGTSIGPPFIPALLPPPVVRSLSGSPPAEPDSSVVARDAYGPFSFDCQSAPPCPSTASFMPALENFSHNDSHGYIGGNMNLPSTSAQDPFFFLLHTNVDKLWAEWQRNPANVTRLDPAQTYGPSLASDSNLQLTMSPWDGSPGGSASASSTQIQPWVTTTPAPTGGNYVVVKTPNDPSVVAPPIYDSAPLTIPILQPGQAVVLQIPWYPPNPANFTSFGSDQYHFCLLARIETSPTAPFGMTTPEISDVNANTKNNNHIVWKNITVLENLPGPHMRFPILMRNPFDEPIKASLRFVPDVRSKASLFEYGRVTLDLGPELNRRWSEGGSAGRQVKPLGEPETGRLEMLNPNALIENIRLNPKETFPVSLILEIRKNYPIREGAFPEFDLVQIGAPGNPNVIVGGQRFVLNLSRLVLVKAGDVWRYWDAAKSPREGWRSQTYDDSTWRTGSAPFGIAHHLGTTLKGGPRPPVFFRRSFEVEDPGLYRSALLRVVRANGARVYLNGKELFPEPVPGASPKSHAPPSLNELQRESLFPIKIDVADLKAGTNVIAAELPQESRRSPEMEFDLELSANNAAGFAPDIAFEAPAEAAYVQAGEIVTVHLEANASQGKIESVSLDVDGQTVGTSKQPPYDFNWPASAFGAHRLRAIAVDDQGKQSEILRTVTVVESLLPHVKLNVPARQVALREGKTIGVSAEASQRNGKIDRVEFWAKDMAFFTSPGIKIATVKAPPYNATIKGLKPGHYMVWAIAFNDRGGSTQSSPWHVTAEAAK